VYKRSTTLNKPTKLKVSQKILDERITADKLRNAELIWVGMLRSEFERWFLETYGTAFAGAVKKSA